MGDMSSGALHEEETSGLEKSIGASQQCFWTLEAKHGLGRKRFSTGESSGQVERRVGIS